MHQMIDSVDKWNQWKRGREYTVVLLGTDGQWEEGDFLTRGLMAIGAEHTLYHVIPTFEHVQLG